MGPALPLQLAGRMTATIESQDAMLAQHRVVAERHRERIETVSDINEAIARLRRGHLVGCASPTDRRNDPGHALD